MLSPFILCSILCIGHLSGITQTSTIFLMRKSSFTYFPYVLANASRSNTSRVLPVTSIHASHLNSRLSARCLRRLKLATCTLESFSTLNCHSHRCTIIRKYLQSFKTYVLQATGGEVDGLLVYCWRSASKLLVTCSSTNSQVGELHGCDMIASSCPFSSPLLLLFSRLDYVEHQRMEKLVQLLFVFACCVFVVPLKYG